ncbi:hypothetical protein JCM3770_004481, partial [Rhodotorula araucariae]
MLPTLSKRCAARWNIATVQVTVGNETREEKHGYHEGWHSHAQPPVRSLPAHILADVAALASAEPSLKPAALIAGRRVHEPEHPQHRPSFIDIHPKLNSSATVRRAIDAGFAADGHPRFKAPRGAAANRVVSLSRVAELAKRVPETLSEICIKGGDITLHVQSPRMRAWLNQEDPLVEISIGLGRAGLATDAHNTYFDGSWVLIQTVVFVDSRSRWLPVAYTIAANETTEVYRRHFSFLLSSFHISFELDDIAPRFLHVADFSTAQNAGFIEACKMFFIRKERLGQLDVEAGELEGKGVVFAEQLVRGCQRHLDANIIRCARSLKVADDAVPSLPAMTPSVTVLAPCEEHAVALVSTRDGWPRTPGGRIVEPTWEHNSCWLDARLAVLAACLQLHPQASAPPASAGDPCKAVPSRPPRFSLEPFFTSKASQSPAELTAWRELNNYFAFASEGADGIPVTAVQARLTTLRNEVRLALSGARVLHEQAHDPYAMHSDEGWWIDLLQRYSVSPGSPDVDLLSLFMHRSLRIHLCTDGHLRYDARPCFKADSIQLAAYFYLPGPAFTSLQQIVDLELLQQGASSSRELSSCHEVTDGIPKCAAPATTLQRFLNLPFFLSFSLSLLSSATYGCDGDFWPSELVIKI